MRGCNLGCGVGKDATGKIFMEPVVHELHGLQSDEGVTLRYGIVANHLHWRKRENR